MATKTKLRDDTLYTLAVDVRFNGELYEAGLNLLGNDEIVKARPECFSEFALGWREVVKVRDALEAANLEEERQQRARAEAARPKEQEPAKPPMVICRKQFVHNNQTVSVGEIWRADHPVVQSAANAFVAIEG